MKVAYKVLSSHNKRQKGECSQGWLAGSYIYFHHFILLFVFFFFFTLFHAGKLFLATFCFFLLLWCCEDFHRFSCRTSMTSFKFWFQNIVFVYVWLIILWFVSKNKFKIYWHLHLQILPNVALIWVYKVLLWT